jgi:hypothetical protein
VVEYLVDHAGAGSRRGRTNPGEARVITTLVKAITEIRGDDGKTLGATTVPGDEQAGLIQALALKLVGPTGLARRRQLRQFQGDEGRVVFLSIADSPAGASLVRQEPLFKQQRYNFGSAGRASIAIPDPESDHGLSRGSASSASLVTAAATPLADRGMVTGTAGRFLEERYPAG